MAKNEWPIFPQIDKTGSEVHLGEQNEDLQCMLPKTALPT